MQSLANVQGAVMAGSHRPNPKFCGLGCKSFSSSLAPHDNREALAFSNPDSLRIAHRVKFVHTGGGFDLGAFLLCARCSLRFGDIQRI